MWQFRIRCLFAFALFLSACATADQTIQSAPPVVRPKPLAVTPASQGSLFPASLGTGTPRPLFEDRRARSIGDILQVRLQESTLASRSGSNRAARDSSVGLSVTPILKADSAETGRKSPFANALKWANLEASASTEFEGSGASRAQNAFTGTIMVMVTQVLSNGNLVVAGEKQVVIGAEEEVIRFSGIINPSDLTGNAVLSTQVADARLEYRGRGSGDDATRPGWLTRGIFKAWPF
ncbi:MAG: flagellar basal body L-ring protein FlgH [Betaproteobacteria bacterium]|nr:flagellar basal body L-ring protein FlgH [Betaproteobacteria bacterium]